MLTNAGWLVCSIEERACPVAATRHHPESAPSTRWLTNSAESSETQARQSTHWLTSPT